MAGRAKSDTKKQQIANEERDALMDRAVRVYQDELAKPRGESQKGSQTVCQEMEEQYRREKGKFIHLAPTTLRRRAGGVKSQAESNAERSWLTTEEADLVISYIIEMSNRGFPLSHRRLKEHVDELLRACLGDQFPEGGVGKNWTQRFVEKHSDHLKTSWATSLDSKRGRAVNPSTNEAWWKLLGDVKQKYNIQPHNTYGVDEFGTQSGTGERERVIGPKKRGPHYQQRSGNCENITVIVTICGDGSSLPPAVIFKGSAYQVQWKQDNPADAS